MTNKLTLLALLIALAPSALYGQASPCDAFTLCGGSGGGAGSGDVVGPASSTDEAICRFDSTAGKLIQNGSVTLSDTTGVFTQTTVNTGFTLAPNGTGQVLIGRDGALATPAVAFSTDTDCGWNRASANDMYLICDGGATWSLIEIDANGAASDGRTRLYNSDSSGIVEVGAGFNGPRLQGNIGVEYTFQADTNTGLNYVGADSFALTTNNVNRLTASNTAITNTVLSIQTPQAVTCTDELTGANGAVTITPTSSLVHVTNQDPTGCDVTMGETGMVSGTELRIVIVAVVAAEAVNFADAAGISELAGAFAANLHDSLTLSYISDRWVEMARSAN